jgi:hypothetical protein
MPANRWIGANAAGNWSRRIVPDSDSRATIGAAGDYTVVIAAEDQPITVAALTLSGTGNHTLTDHGILSVDGNTKILGNTPVPRTWWTSG